MKLWVRWCFRYDDKSWKVGVWNYDGPKMEEKWQFQRLHQMIQAELHVKDITNGQTSVLHQCTRDDFLHFAWMRLAVMSPFIDHGKGMELPGKNIGLTLHQRNGHKVTAFNDGRIVRDRKKKKKKCLLLPQQSPDRS